MNIPTKHCAAFLLVGMAAGLLTVQTAFPGESAETDPTEAAAQVNALGCDLYGQLRAQPGNLILSPASISAALSMAAAGSQGETEREFLRLFHAASTSDTGTAVRLLAARMVSARRDPWLTQGRLLQTLRPATGSPLQLQIANALWGQTGYPFASDYLGWLQAAFGTTVEHADFRADPEAARRRINGWTFEHTGAMIPDLFAPGSLSEDTRLVLVNAVYFKGRWTSPFAKAATTEGPFSIESNRLVTVSFMNRVDHYPYGETPDYQALELPYAGGDFGMLILLPGSGRTLSDLESALAPDLFSNVALRLAPRQVAVSVPRFGVESSFALAGVLTSLGLKSAFTPVADFGGMSSNRDLFISAVVHKARADVNEEGTEAAAATGVEMRLTAAMPEPPVVFRADRPFLFAIRHRPTGTLLFLGRIVTPKA